MKHYYIKDNRIWMANEKMPVKENRNFHFTLSQSEKNEIVEKEIKQWIKSLQPCEISESELENVKTHLMPKVGYNTIDITSLVSDNNGVITFKEKQVDGEIEAVEFAEWCDKQVTYIDKNGNVDYKQLYEIFKNKK